MKRVNQLLKILIVILLFGCQNSNSSDEKVNETNQQEIEIYEAIVGSLRVRTEPTTNSRILYELKERQKVEFLNEKSDNKETIKLRGKEIEENWFKIKVVDEPKVIGWVFGGAISPEGENDLESDNPETATAEIQKKEIKKLTAKNAERLFKIEGISEEHEPYSGFYEYYSTVNGSEILDGDFKIVGKNPLGDAVYSGVFSNGNKNGKFVSNFAFDEWSAITTVVFDNNSCVSKKISGSDEAMNFQHTYQKPNCSFIYQDYSEEKALVEEAQNQSNFDNEIGELERKAAFENSLKGKWVMQKFTVIEPDKEEQEISGGIANQSILNLKDNNRLDGKFTFFGGKAITGEGLWYIDNEDQKLTLHIGNIIDGHGRKRDEVVIIESKLKNIKNNYANVEVISMKWDGENAFPRGEKLELIVKKE